MGTKASENYLILQIEGVLDGERSAKPPQEEDLLITKVQRDKFQVLRGGARIVKSLQEIVDRYQWKIVFYSMLTERKQTSFLKMIDEACRLKEIGPFPNVKAMIVCDDSCFSGVTSENSIIIKSRNHGILLAGYGVQLEDKMCARKALSKLLDIDEKDRKNHLMFDASHTSARQAQLEGWNVYNLAEKNIEEALTDALDKMKTAYSTCQLTQNREEPVIQHVPTKNADMNELEKQKLSEQGVQDPIPQEIKNKQFCAEIPHDDKEPTQTAQIKKPKKTRIPQPHIGMVFSRKMNLFQVMGPVENFVSRRDEMDQLVEHLLQSSKKISYLAIIGVAGIGKTQLAAQYLKNCSQDVYSEIVWIHADQKNTILDQINHYMYIHHKYLPGSLEKSELLKIFYHKLGRLQQKSCVLFDNAQCLGDIEEYLPRNDYEGNRLDILITSRFSKWGNKMNHIIRLKPFLAKETRKYLKRCDPDFQEESQAIEKFNSLLGGLPLAISQAEAFVRETKTYITKFNQKFETLKDSYRKKWEELEEYDEQIKTIFILLEIILSELKVKNTLISSVLGAASYLWSGNVSKNLESCWEFCKQNQGESGFEDALELLQKYRIFTNSECIENHIAQHEGGSAEPLVLEIWKPHSLTQEALRWMHQNEGRYSQNYELVLEWILKGVDYKNEKPADITRVSRIISHADYLNSLPSNLALQTKIELLNVIGNHQLMNGGNHKLALECFEKVHKSKKKQYGDGKLQTEPSLLSLGTAWGCLGDYQKQKDYLTEALSINRIYSDDYDLKTSKILEGLGNAWGQLGNYKEAVSALTQALKIKQKRYDNNDFRLAITLRSLGNALSKLRQWDAARENLKQSLQICENNFGSEHLESNRILSDLAILLIESGENEEAKNYLSRALPFNRSLYGKNHRIVGFTLRHLGFALGKLGDTKNAQEHLSEARKIIEKHFGEKHPETAEVLIDQGELISETTEIEKAQDLLIKAIDILDSGYPTQYLLRGRAKTLLGKILLFVGYTDQAEELVKESLKLVEENCGKDHGQNGKTLQVLGKIYHTKHNMSSARKYLEQALRIQENWYGKIHPQLVETLYLLGNIAHVEKNDALAYDYLDRSVQMAQKYFPKNSRKMGELLKTYAVVQFNSKGNAEESIRLFSQALKIHEDHLGKDHVMLVEILTNLGSICFNAKKVQEANKYYTRSLEILQDYRRNLLNSTGYLNQESLYPTLTNIDHQLIKVLYSLGNIHFDSKNYEEVIQYAGEGITICNRVAVDPNFIVWFQKLLGCSYKSIGMNNEAAKHLNSALKESKISNASEADPIIGEILGDLGDIFYDCSDTGKAVIHYQQALDILSVKYGIEHPRVQDLQVKIQQITA